jgi:hypothetical protein
MPWSKNGTPIVIGSPQSIRPSARPDGPRQLVLDVIHRVEVRPPNRELKPIIAIS